MDRAANVKPFVHLPIDAVDTVVYDPEGKYDPECFDHYATFIEARDAALSSVELLLDEGDYDGEDHREELVADARRARNRRDLRRAEREARLSLVHPPDRAPRGRTRPDRVSGPFPMDTPRVPELDDANARQKKR